MNDLGNTINEIVKNWGVITAVAMLIVHIYKIKIEFDSLSNKLDKLLADTALIISDAERLLVDIANNDATHGAIIEALKDHVKSNEIHDQDVKTGLTIIKDRLDRLERYRDK